MKSRLSEALLVVRMCSDDIRHLVVGVWICNKAQASFALQSAGQVAATAVHRVNALKSCHMVLHRGVNRAHSCPHSSANGMDCALLILVIAAAGLLRPARALLAETDCYVCCCRPWLPTSNWCQRW